MEVRLHPRAPACNRRAGAGEMPDPAPIQEVHVGVYCTPSAEI